MAFNGTEGGLISLQQGAALTAAFRQNFPQQIKARFFGKDVLNELLNQQDAMGLRIYFGQNAQGHFELVVCAANAKEDDMLDKIADLSVPCPNMCGRSNALNS